MSSKFKVLSIALAALMALSFYSATTKADVTGSFGIHLSFEPIQCQNLPLFDILNFPDQPCEKTFFKIDFETSININITISGLTVGIHAHTGVTGFEDIILSFATTLGALDITDTFVFAQAFASVFLLDGEEIPTCLEDQLGSGVCLTLFVKKRVDMSISLGGVTFSNLAMFEDVNWPNYCLDFFLGFVDASFFDLFGCIHPIKGLDTGVVYNQQSQEFGFGDVITLSGQTPSGITVTSITGICAEQLVNAIKKHTWDHVVNADCVGNNVVVKPPVLFSFEKLFIEGIPLTPNLTLDVSVYCGSLEGSAAVGAFFPCNLFNTITVTGGPIFDSITVTSGFEDILGPGTFTDVEVTASGGPLFLIIDFDPATFTPTFIFAQASFTLNPDTNPASLRLRAIGIPNIVRFEALLTVRRAGLTFTANTRWNVDAFTHTFVFRDLRLGLSAAAGIVNIAGDILIRGQTGGTGTRGAFLVGGDVTFTVAF